MIMHLLILLIFLQLRLWMNKAEGVQKMSVKYAVFSDYCDAGQEIFDNYADAKKYFIELIDDKYRNQVDAYLCKVVQSYKVNNSNELNKVNKENENVVE